MLEWISGNPVIAIALVIWVLPWKGLALWKAALRKQKIWFVVLLVLNTMAILEILYIFYFSEANRMRGKEEDTRSGK